MDPQFEAKVRPAYRTLLVIWIAIGVAILIMAVLAVALAGAEATDATEEGARVLLPVFLGLGGAAIAAGVAVRRRTETAARAAPGLDSALSRIRVGTIIACACSEVSAILGLAYLLLGGSTAWAPVFFGAALLSWAVAVPRLSRWEELLSAQGQGPSPVIST